MAAKSVISTFSSKVLVALCGLLLVVMVSRNLGAGGRGEVSVITSGMALILVFCEFVSGSALINLSYTKPQTHLFVTGIIWSALVCAIAFLLLYMFPFIESSYRLHLPVMAFLLSVITIGNALLMGRRHVMLRNILLVLQPLVVLLSVAILFNRMGMVSVHSYVVGLYTGLLATLMLSLWFQYKALSRHDLKTFRFDKEILHSGFWAQTGHLVQFLNYRLSFFIIAWLAGKSSLGIYNNAIVLAETLWIFGHSLGQIQHIQILNNTTEGFDKAITLRYIHLCIPVTAVFLLIVLLLPAMFWQWLFGADFSGMRHVLLWLSPAVMCFSISVILNHYYHARNRFGIIIMANLCGLLAGTVILFVLIGPMGLTGAAISACCCHAAILGYYLLRSASDGFISMQEILTFSNFRNDVRELWARLSSLR